MADLWRKIGSPRNLIVFEAAARAGSFTRAAEALHMQQPSVSAAIKQLEQALGVSLFQRMHRAVTLTAAGERLYADVSRALTDIERSVDAVRQRGEATHVTLSASSAFTYYWMMPRLHRLRAAHPEIDLRMQSSDREPDLEAENISLGIRLGAGPWSGCAMHRLADEVIFPVASPRVMAAARNLRSIPNLLHERLIHLEEPIRERPTWAQWFAHHGVPSASVAGGLRLNDYALVLQAAVADEGFAFGWEHIVRNIIDRKLLVARSDWAWRTGNGIYLVWPATKALSENAIRVRDWIVSESDSAA